MCLLGAIASKAMTRFAVVRDAPHPKHDGEREAKEKSNICLAITQKEAVWGNDLSTVTAFQTLLDGSP